MNHKKNRLLEINTGIKTKTVFVKNLLSSLIKNGKVTTTPKRAKVLKSEADKFFSNLLNICKRFDDAKDAKRECIRYVKLMIYGEDDGKKVINTLLPKYQETKQKSFVADYKVGYRTGDATPKILVKLI